MLVYSGGLEMLFSNERKHNVTLPARLENGSQPTIADLLTHLVENVMQDQRKELFIMEDNVYVEWILIWTKISLTNLAVALESLFSSMTPIGSSKARRPTNSSRETT